MIEIMFFFSTLLFGVLVLILFSWLLISVLSFFKQDDKKQHYEKVTVIIPTYNEQKNIKKCINSILELNYPEKYVEIIVVDDGSTDNTTRTVKNFKKVKLITQKHLGKVHALNKGLKNARGDVILTIDADTFLEKNSLNELMRYFSDENVGAVTGVLKVLNPNKIICFFQEVEYAFNSLVRKGYATIGSVIGLWGAMTAFRKEALKKIGGFPIDTTTEDFDVAVSIQKFGYKLKVAWKAVGYTYVPQSLKGWFNQRIRWSKGILQTLIKNRSIFFTNSITWNYAFLTQIFWYLYSWIGLPLIFIQILYWLPYNSQNVFRLAWYFVCWFSLIGSFYNVYMIPPWGMSLNTLLGILSGFITTTISFLALRSYYGKFKLRHVFAVMFYFPYCILMNISLILGVIFYFRNRRSHFMY